MAIKEKLKKISELTGEKYVEVKDGITKYLFTDEIIPLRLHIFQKARPDGIYRLGENTCGGGSLDKEGGVCKIGAPAQRCVINESYSIRKCAVYNFRSLDSIDLSYEQIFQLMENEKLD